MPQNYFFIFETKAPKIVQEKWEVLPPRMENRFASNLLVHFGNENSQNCSRKIGSIPPRMEKRFASNLFFTFETEAPKIVQEKWAAFPP